MRFNAHVFRIAAILLAAPHAEADTPVVSVAPRDVAVYAGEVRHQVIDLRGIFRDPAQHDLSDHDGDVGGGLLFAATVQDSAVTDVRHNLSPRM